MPKRSPTSDYDVLVQIEKEFKDPGAALYNNVRINNTAAAWLISAYKNLYVEFQKLKSIVGNIRDS